MGTPCDHVVTVLRRHPDALRRRRRAATGDEHRQEHAHDDEVHDDRDPDHHEDRLAGHVAEDSDTGAASPLPGRDDRSDARGMTTVTWPPGPNGGAARHRRLRSGRERWGRGRVHRAGPGWPSPRSARSPPLSSSSRDRLDVTGRLDDPPMTNAAVIPFQPQDPAVGRREPVAIDVVGGALARRLHRRPDRRRAGRRRAARPGRRRSRRVRRGAARRRPAGSRRACPADRPGRAPGRRGHRERRRRPARVRGAPHPDRPGQRARRHGPRPGPPPELRRRRRPPAADPRDRSSATGAGSRPSSPTSSTSRSGTARSAGCASSSARTSTATPRGSPSSSTPPG